MEIKNEQEKIELEKKKIQLEQEKIENIRRQETLESMRKGTEFVRILKIGCLIPFILVIILLAVSIIIAIKDQVVTNDNNDKNIVQEVAVEGNFNEPVSTSTFSVTCDGYEEFERYSEPTNGYKYVRFHFTVENISDKELYDEEKIRALVNGVQCERASFSDKKQLPEAYIIPGGKIDGYIGFEIPENAKKIDIKYGDYITIHVDMNK